MGLKTASLNYLSFGERKRDTARQEICLKSTYALDQQLNHNYLVLNYVVWRGGGSRSPSPTFPELAASGTEFFKLTLRWGKVVPFQQLYLVEVRIVGRYTHHKSKKNYIQPYKLKSWDQVFQYFITTLQWEYMRNTTSVRAVGKGSILLLDKNIRWKKKHKVNLFSHVHLWCWNF